MDHMTSIPTSFTYYSLLSGQDKVTIADGTCATIACKGSIRLSDHLTLSSTLHVPSPSVNLHSVSNLTKQLQCLITFLSDHYVFQDLLTRQMIGISFEVDGIYTLQLREQSVL